MATIGSGLICYNPKSGISTQYSTSDSSSIKLVSDNITILKFSKQDNRLYIGGKSSYLESIDIDDSSYSRYSISKESETFNLKALELDNSGNIWIGTYRDGLIRLNLESKEFVNWSTSSSSISSNMIFDLKFQTEDRLLIATDGGGLETLDISSNSFIHCQEDVLDPSGLSSNAVLCLYQDENRILWVGTHKGGINYYDEIFNQFQTKRVYDGLSNSRVLSFCQYDSDNIIIGTDGGGIDIFNEISRDLESVPYPKDLNSCITSIERYRDNMVLLGTYGSGILTYNTISGAIQEVLPNSFCSKLRDIYIMDIQIVNGDIWFGTPYGLFWFNIAEGVVKQLLLGGVKTLDSDIEDGFNSIQSISVESDTTLWIGTKSGVYSVNSRRYVVEKSSELLSLLKSRDLDDVIVKSILSEDSLLWICTEDNGLIKCNRDVGDIFIYNNQSGFKSNNIYDIHRVEEKYWVSTSQGVSIIGSGDSDIITLDYSNGLQGYQFNCAMLSEKGELFLGGESGFNHFFISEIEKNVASPALEFIDFKLFNQSVDFNSSNSVIDKHISRVDQITLEYTQNVFSLEFVALNYNSPDKNCYAYKMDNFDKEWNYVEHNNSATYTSLLPGDYTFRVKASNNDGIWTDEDLTINITVLPPWYKSKLAFIGYLLLFSSLMFAFYRVLMSWANLNHKLELEIVENINIEKRNRDRIIFFTNISHEFKTPLTLINAPLDKMIKSGNGTVEEFRLIKQSADRLLRLVNQLMDFRKIETGNVQLAESSFEFNDFIEDIVNSFRSMSAQREILLNYSGIEKLNVYLDRDKLDKIIFNLLSNAFKACRGGDRVEVVTSILKKQQSGLGDKYDRLIIQVKDTGRGISQDNITKIFDRFYQIDQHSGGTGVGLSLSKSYVELMRGTIDVDSKLNEGTCFTITVPFYMKRGAVEQLPKIENITTSVVPINRVAPSNSDVGDNDNKRLLMIVEDDIEILNFLANSFSEHYRVIEAIDGQDGFEKIILNSPDIIISDVMMPRVDGFELCRLIKDDIRVNHIPIILLTAVSNEEKVLEGTELGADLYISKPFSFSLLTAQVNNILRKRDIVRDNFMSIYFSKGEDSYLSDSANEDFVSSEESLNTTIELPIKDQIFMDKLSSIVLNHLDNSELSVEMLSREMAIHRTNLYEKLKSIAAVTPSEFIRTVRLMESIQYIKDEALSISEVAYRVGFNTPAYFSKCFKKKFGKLPVEYRKSLDI